MILLDEKGSIRWNLLVSLVTLGFSLLGIALLMQISSTPTFCGTCHVMQPYYQSWKTSTHNTVPCVECHIPPGITSEIRKKYEALSMFVRYITQTYGTNPWAEVDDVSCLRCHDRRLIQGKELFHNVLFDHTPHLLEMRRGKRLRCTSCHSQIVQGSHISVTESTCFLCHFKDQSLQTGTARCELCHIVPTHIVGVENVRFNHAQVVQFGMDCLWCHKKSVQGDGAVPRSRCLTCHNEPQRLSQYYNTEQLHAIHVSQHKVECLHCHMEIQHGKFPLQAAATSCEKCHTSGHNPVRDLYAGIGGVGPPPQPDPMFQTGVDCEGCHFLDAPEKGGLKRANEVSCMACHGPGYQKIYRTRLPFLKTILARTESAYYEARRHSIPESKLKDVAQNLNLIREGGPIHNPEYSLALLSWSFNQLQTALHERTGTTLPPLPIPESKNPCFRCHQGIELQSAVWESSTFSHSVHVLNQKIDCQTCHRSHEQRSLNEILKPGVNCTACHHRTDSGKTCVDCHEQGPKETLTLADGRKFPHPSHVDPDLELNCRNCHGNSGKPIRTKICSDCH